MVLLGPWYFIWCLGFFKVSFSLVCLAGNQGTEEVFRSGKSDTGKIF